MLKTRYHLDLLVRFTQMEPLNVKREMNKCEKVDISRTTVFDVVLITIIN